MKDKDYLLCGMWSAVPGRTIEGRDELIVNTRRNIPVESRTSSKNGKRSGCTRRKHDEKQVTVQDVQTGEKRPAPTID